MKPLIFYVDDVLSNLVTFEAQLDDQEWDIRFFSDPIEAEKNLTAFNPCIVVSDQQMPKMSGSQFLSIVKKKLPYSIRVILTGFSEEDAAINAINDANVFAYIKKPFKEGELEAVMRRAYDHFTGEMLSHSVKPMVVPDIKKRMLEDLGKKTSPDSDLRRIYNLFQYANEELKIKIPEKVLEEWTVIIDNVMSARYRRYHTNDHIFTMSATDEPIEILAAIFHDLVYIHIDRRIHPLMEVYLPDFKLDNPDGSIENIQYTVTLPKEFHKSFNLELTKWVFEIFSVHPGQVLTPMTGVNEFLSAVFVARTLGNYLKGWGLFQVLICIEATIPFRKKSADGKYVAEQFREKLPKLISACGLTVPEDQIEKAMKRWVNVANLDVITFGSEELGLFLGNTWTLILEGNVTFSNPSYSIEEYRIALCKNEAFFNFLVPELVFRKYDDFPVNFNMLISNCALNLKNGVEYINAKQIAVLAQEAIAMLTGGMCPIALFNGKRHSEPGEPANRLENFLDHSIPRVNLESVNPIVYQLLNEGRPARVEFDLKNSPLATYFYTRLSSEQRTDILAGGRKFWSGDLEASDVLKLYPKRLILSLLKGVMEIAPTRSSQFAALRESIKES